MRAYFFYLLLNFTMISPLLGQPLVNSSSLTDEQKKQISGERNLTMAQIQALWKGEVLSQVRVKTKQKTQSLDLWVSGFHPHSCHKALRKISYYEGYPEMLSFIKSSQYDDTSKRWKLKIDHALMPFPMYLDFTMERVRKKGTYPFTFESGFLQGLLGEVAAQEIGQRCQLTLTSKWSGPASKIPDLVFSTFVQTLAELGLRNLIRSTIL